MKSSNTCRDRTSRCLRLPSPRLLSLRLLSPVAFGLIGIFSGDAAAVSNPGFVTSQYIHDLWGPEKGFVGGTIYAICQSGDGYLWIGTERGLVRFDGSSFTLIQQPVPGRSPIGPVRGLAKDPQGNLWILPEGPRLTLYRDGRFQDAVEAMNLQVQIFTAMGHDYSTAVLLSGLDGSILRYGQRSLETVIGGLKVPGVALSLTQTRDGKFWIGTQEDGLFSVSSGRVSAPIKALANTQINTLLASAGAGLWIGTNDGILFWDGQELARIPFPSPIGNAQVLGSIQDVLGTLWVGTSRGLVRIAPDHSASVADSSSRQGTPVRAVFQDRDGAIWFGSSRGLERLRMGAFTTYSATEELSSENNGPIYVDDEGRSWFAPLSGGLYWLKDGQVQRVQLAGLDNDVVYSISGGAGEIWLGRQSGGLTVLTSNGNASNSFTAKTFTKADGLAQNSVYSVHRTRDGTVWAGTVSEGVSRWQNGRFTNFSVADKLASNTINSIVEGHDGTMWFATPNGLTSHAGNRWRTLATHENLPSSNIRCIFEDSRHVLWIATSNGLAYLSSGRIGIARHLPASLSEQIFGIAEDGLGSLWFTTSDHVLQVNRQRLLDGSLDESDVQSFGIADGLQGHEGVQRDRSIVADGLGRIWVSLNRGLAVTDPKSALGDPNQINVRVDSMFAGTDLVDLSGARMIAPGTRTIVFNYASTSLSGSDRIRFRYTLDGSGQGWSRVLASRQVVFTNLGPGSYRFRVVASNGNGLWNGPETVVPFAIEPDFWQTWWFRVACLAGCLLAAMALYRLRIARLTHQLNVRFQERLAERTRIAQDLHDTLLQGVLSASMQLDVAEDQLPGDSPAKPRLQRVLQLLSHVTQEGRHALRGLRGADKSVPPLEIALSDLRQELAIDEKIAYRVIVNGNPRQLRPLVRDDICRIGREAVVNAVLHSQAASIEVEVEYSGRYLRVSVRDDGRGMDPKVLQSGREGHWGLVGMRERSESIGATVKLRSRLGAGTEVELTVPGVLAFADDSSGPLPRWISWWIPNRNGKPAASKGQESIHERHR